MAAVLVAFASTYGTTREVAQHLADAAQARGHDVHLLDLTDRADAPLPAADTVIVASAVYSNQAHHDVVKWLTEHAEALADRDTALVSISLAAAIEGDDGEAMCLDYVDELTTVTGFAPKRVELVAGALDESRYDPATKALLKVAEWRRRVDVSGDVSLTDWAAVDALAERWLG